jgi:hypothetical protein
MDQNDPKLRRIWAQKRVPVVARGGPVRPLLVRLPYSTTNRDWLQMSGTRSPEWLPNYRSWSIPKTWFENVLRRAIDAYGSVFVIQPFRAAEKCAPACWNAVGAECECSCLGENHGAGNPEGKWHIVSETFAVKWNEREYSCRLLKALPDVPTRLRS